MRLSVVGAAGGRMVWCLSRGDEKKPTECGIIVLSSLFGGSVSLKTRGRRSEAALQPMGPSTHSRVSPCADEPAAAASVQWQAVWYATVLYFQIDPAGTETCIPPPA
jgi:hypothetical protein